MAVLAALTLLASIELTRGSPSAQEPVPELKRLTDLDLRPPSPWLDLASVGDWIPFGTGIATLAWRGTLSEFELFLQVYDGDGKLLHEVRLPSKEGASVGAGTEHAGRPARICALGEHEIGVLPERTGEHEFVGERVDLASGTLSPWPIPAFISFDSRGTPVLGGDFLELAVKTPDRSPSLRRLGPDGGVRWTLDRSSGFWADGGLTPGSDGSILTWHEQDPPAIQVVGPEGRVVRTKKLEEIQPGYSNIRGIAAGARGECYVDIGPQPRRILHLDAGLNVLESFVPRFPNGSEQYSSIQCARDGRLWIYDGFCFARLTAGGAVERIVGPAPGAPVLQSARPVHITNDGRIFAFSDRDGTLFELDAAAKVLKVYEPSDHAFHYEDLEWQAAPPELATRYRWHSFDEGRRLWRLESTRARLLRADESELLGVTLLPVMLSEAKARPLAVSRTGLFALQISATSIDELRVLDPEGKVRVRVPLDGKSVRFASVDDRHLALTTASTVEVYDMLGSLVGHAELPPDGWIDFESCANQPDEKWRVDVRAEAQEIWLRQGPNTLIVRRYALP
jgi:hypothetical protein